MTNEQDDNTTVEQVEATRDMPHAPGTPGAVQKHIEVKCFWDGKVRLMRLSNPELGPPKPPLGAVSGTVEDNGKTISGRAMCTGHGTETMPLFIEGHGMPLREQRAA